MRRDVIFSSEYKARPPRSNELPKDSYYLNRAYVPVDRYNKNIEVFNRFNLLKYDYLIVFGEEEIALMKEIPDIAYRIILTAQTTLACADYDIKLMKSNEKIFMVLR
jgi:hypothetical protein